MKVMNSECFHATDNQQKLANELCRKVCRVFVCRGFSHVSASIFAHGCFVLQRGKEILEEGVRGGGDYEREEERAN